MVGVGRGLRGGRTDLHKHKAGMLQRASGQKMDCPMGRSNVQQPDHTAVKPPHNKPAVGSACPAKPCALLNHLRQSSKCRLE